MALGKSLGKLEALGQFLAHLLGARLCHCLLEFLHQRNQFNTGEQIPDGICTHAGTETIFTKLVLGFAQFLLSKQLCQLKGRLSRIRDDVILVINHPLEHARAHIQHEPDT